MVELTDTTSWDNHVRGILRFGSKAALARGLRAFDALAYPEYFDRSLLVERDLVFEMDRAFEIEADCDAWPSLLALAREAADGVVTLLDRRSRTENVRVVLHRDSRGRRYGDWIDGAYTSGTPTGQLREQQVRAKRRELGLDDPEPPAAGRFDMALLAAARTPATLKALHASLGIGMADGRALLDALPQWIGRNLSEGQAAAAKEALESAGAQVRVDPFP